MFTHRAPRSSQELAQWNVRAFQGWIRIWKCWFLRRGENRSTQRKTSRSRVENQQQTQPPSPVGGERSHHYAIPALWLVFSFRYDVHLKSIRYLLEGKFCFNRKNLDAEVQRCKKQTNNVWQKFLDITANQLGNVWHDSMQSELKITICRGYSYVSLRWVKKSGEFFLDIFIFSCWSNLLGELAGHSNTLKTVWLLHFNFQRQLLQRCSTSTLYWSQLLPVLQQLIAWNCGRKRKKPRVRNALQIQRKSILYSSV